MCIRDSVSPDPQQAYVGRNAFAHKGGLHVSGIAADPRTFEHVPPAAVGNVPHILVSELSGKGTVRRRLEDLGIQADSGDEVVERLLQRLKPVSYTHLRAHE